MTIQWGQTKSFNLSLSDKLIDRDYRPKLLTIKGLWSLVWYGIYSTQTLKCFSSFETYISFGPLVFRQFHQVKNWRDNTSLYILELHCQPRLSKGKFLLLQSQIMLINGRRFLYLSSRSASPSSSIISLQIESRFSRI